MIVMVLAALAAMQTAPSGAVTNSQIEAARRALDAQLLDYPSARFRDVRGNDRYICGFVNAKNRLGAFSGWSRFVSVKSSGRLYLDGSSDGDRSLIDTFCGEDGLRNQGRDYSDQMTRRGG